MMYGKDEYSDGKNTLAILGDGKIKLNGDVYSLNLDVTFAPADLDVYSNGNGAVGVGVGGGSIILYRCAAGENDPGFGDTREIMYELK